jgi:large subunit ribosomal protein L32
MRRSHNALEAVGTTTCKECGAVIKPHRVCKKCGSYKGKKVAEVKDAE